MDTIVMIPAFNEEKNITEVVQRTKNTGFLPLVIDDGSNDKTTELAKKAGAVVVTHSKNKGKGEAMTTGFKYVLENYPKTKYVVILDADLQYDPEDTPKLIKMLKSGKADYVTGYRNWKTVPSRHSLGNFVWRTSFNILFGTKFKDTNCGFIAMTISAMRKMMAVTYGGYIIENMMLSEALKNELKIKQVSVRVHYHHIRKIPTGTKIVLGCLWFIAKRGIKYRLGMNY